MKVSPTKIEGVLLIEPKVFGDARGFILDESPAKVQAGPAKSWHLAEGADQLARYTLRAVTARPRADFELAMCWHKFSCILQRFY